MARILVLLTLAHVLHVWLDIIVVLRWLHALLAIIHLLALQIAPFALLAIIV